MKPIIPRIKINRPVFIRSYKKKTTTGKRVKIAAHIRGGARKKRAYQIKKKLKPVSNRVEIAGSIRRGDKNPKDIDLVVIPKDPNNLTDIKRTIRKMKGNITLAGKKNLTANIQGTKTNIFFANKKDFNSQLFQRTGPKGSAIQNRILARQKGYILNQYGLFDRKTGKIVASTAHDIYHKLGKKFRVPSQRGMPR